MNALLRVGYTLCAVAAAAWLPRAGLPLAAVAVVAAALWLRHAADAGRLPRLARSPAAR